MTDRGTATDRMVVFTDAVFAVIITIMVLDLKPPTEAKVSALLALWPTALSYAVSYVFIAIIWINHHRLLLFAHEATPKLIWWNFAHLFITSLIPFSTAWMADTRFAAVPVVFYAAVFVMVNIAFLGYQQEVLSQASDIEVSPTTRRLTRMRALISLVIFITATCVAYWSPWSGFALVCCVVLVYVRPQVPGEGLKRYPPKRHSARRPEPDAREEARQGRRD